MSRYWRYVRHLPRIHRGEEVTELPHLQRNRITISMRLPAMMDWMIVRISHRFGLPLCPPVQVDLLLPAEGDHPSLLQQGGAHLPHRLGHQRQLRQGQTVQETGHVAENLVGQRAQRVLSSSCPTSSLPRSIRGVH